MLKIVHVPNDVLNKPCQPVTAFDGTLKKTVADMEEALKTQVGPHLIGVGLAAPQVGINKRLFIVRPSPKSPLQVFINATILEKKNTKHRRRKTTKKKRRPVRLEGCLSIPSLWGPVKRAEKIFVSYYDVEGNEKKEWFSGFEAVIVQHETDHTDGILFSQRVLEQGRSLYKEEDGKLKKMEF